MPKRTTRDWGHWRVLEDYPPGVKVKELVVNPQKQLSMQKHHQRSELWFVAAGRGVLKRKNSPSITLTQNQMVTIPVGEWHQLENTSSVPLHIVEIQWGDKCTEDDIIRDDDAV